MQLLEKQRVGAGGAMQRRDSEGAGRHGAQKHDSGGWALLRGGWWPSPHGGRWQTLAEETTKGGI